MCGIAGLIKKNRSNGFYKIKKMTETIVHRGINDTCYAVCNTGDGSALIGEDITKLTAGGYFGDVFLGFNRLSIRDVSLNGRQPMADDSKKVLICFNGEIYNAEELRNRYAADYHYRGGADTEVILALYLKYGFERMITMLDGMFAIAVTDLRKNMVFLARDRVGIKPFYYTLSEDHDEFMFGSEIKSFVTNGDFDKRLNSATLGEFFTFGDANGILLLDNTREVEPGETVSIFIGNDAIGENDISRERWFSLNDYERPKAFEESEDEYIEQLETVLARCTKRQLVSDVKSGCQLSGGVDSSLVTLFASREGLADTVSIIPGDKNYSEKEFIDKVAETLNVDEHCFDIDGSFIMDNFREAVWHYESIITYHNTNALLQLSKEAKNYVTVLLSGEGADELFGGYTWFEDGYYASRYLDGRKKGSLNPDPELENRIRGLKNARDYADFAIMCTDIVQEGPAKKILDTEYDRKKIIERRHDFFTGFTGSDFDRHIKYEMSTRLRSLLVRQDKTSMANSIENRVPILDNEMLDLAFKMPKEMLLRDNGEKCIGKYALKKICEKYFGTEFSFRRKVGFPLPFHEYMYLESFKEQVYDVLLPGISRRGYLNEKNIRDMYENGDLNRNRWEFAPLWKAFSFEIWCEEFLDR